MGCHLNCCDLFSSWPVSTIFSDFEDLTTNTLLWIRTSCLCSCSSSNFAKPPQNWSFHPWLAKQAKSIERLTFQASLNFCDTFFQLPSMPRLVENPTTLNRQVDFSIKFNYFQRFFQLPSTPQLKEGPMKVDFLSKLDSFNCFQVPNLQYLEEDQRNQQVQLAAKKKLRKWLKKSGWSFFWILD